MTHPHAALLRRAGADTPDRELLARFAADRDGPAFAELVRRHGPAVLGVCRRAVRHDHDAEDAFQAVFVVLARKAGALRNPDAVGPWLHGVAYRVAGRARRAAMRRRQREVQVPDVPHPPTFDRTPDRDTAAAVDAALAALPEHHRAAVYLCDVAGLSRAEAAQRLGVPEGTLSSRLNAARKKLAANLTRRGVTAPTFALSAYGTADADVSANLAARAVMAAVAGVTGGTMPPAVAALASTGGNAMTKVWSAMAAVALAAGVTGVAVGWDAPPDTQKPGVAKPATDPPAKPVADVAPMPAAGKARLLTASEFAGRYSAMHWDPSGRWLFVHNGSTVRVFVKNAQGPAMGELVAKPLGAFVGVTDAGQVVTYLSGNGRINSPKQIRTWDTETDRLLKPARTVEWDSTDGYPVGVVKAGVVVARHEPPRATQSPRGRGGPPSNGSSREATARYRVIDWTTGEAGPVVATVTYQPPERGMPMFQRVTPDGERVIVAYQKGTGVTAECFSLSDGKPVWRREVAPAGVTGLPGSFDLALASKGGLAALGYVREAEGRDAFGSPQGGMLGAEIAAEVTLFDQGTGDAGPKLPVAEVRGVSSGALSGDGRLLALRVGADGQDVVRVYDTRTGAVLKTWQGSAVVAFAPDRPVLAVLETWTDRPSVPDTRASDIHSSLGFWDLSGLVK